MVIGTTVVITLYLVANVAYLVTLPMNAIQHAPADRVGTATLTAIFPGLGTAIMAAAIGLEWLVRSLIARSRARGVTR